MTKYRFKFIAYADIHYDRLAAQCVTWEDCAEVERALHERVCKGGFNFSLFAGDRFLKRNPEDEVKTRADQVMFDAMSVDARSAPHYSLVGNHDWVTNSRRWHTSESLKLMRSGSKMVVLDTPGTWDIPSLPVSIHALPAGVSFDFSVYRIDPERFNLFVFHDMLKGSFMDDSYTMKFDSGISIEEIDRSEFDLVLAGDIHVPQQFSLKNTRGGYLGAVLQRTRADAGYERGWVEFSVSGSRGSWEIESNFVPTKPLFSCFSFEVGPDSRYEDIRVPDDEVSGRRIEIKLTGKKEDVDRVAEDPRWGNYENILMARKLDVARDYVSETKDAVVDLSSSNSVVSDLGLYLDSGFGSLGTLDRAKMFDILSTLENG